MATLSVQSTVNAETTFAAATATTGDVFFNDGNVYLLVRNGNAANTTVTFDSPAVCNCGVGPNAAHDLVVTCTGNASTPKIHTLGPFPPNRFNDVDGNVTVICAPVTDVSVAAVLER
jgi:hypothetical protein